MVELRCSVVGVVLLLVNSVALGGGGLRGGVVVGFRWCGLVLAVGVVLIVRNADGGAVKFVSFVLVVRHADGCIVMVVSVVLVVRNADSSSVLIVVPAVMGGRGESGGRSCNVM